MWGSSPPLIRGEYLAAELLERGRIHLQVTVSQAETFTQGRDSTGRALHLEVDQQLAEVRVYGLAPGTHRSRVVSLDVREPHDAHELSRSIRQLRYP